MKSGVGFQAHRNYSFAILLSYLGTIFCFSPSWILLRAHPGAASVFMSRTSFVYWSGCWHSLFTQHTIFWNELFFSPTQHKIIQVVACINSLFLFIAEEYSSKRKAMTNLDSIFKSRDNTLPIKVHLIKATVFPVVMYRCESWTIKKPEHQTIDAFKLWFWRRLLRVPWNARRSNQSFLKETSPWVFTGRTDVEAETPILWPPDAKNWLIGKDPDAEKDWRREEKGMTEDEMAGWHHRLNRHGFE